MIQNLIRVSKECFYKLLNFRLVRQLSRKTRINDTNRSRQSMILVVLVIGLAAFIWEQNHQSKALVASEPMKSVDTFIPAGFVLVPIQLSNAEALDSIIGARGVVDLFVPDLKHPGHSKKVAEHIKIIRAPLNPSQFAVLVNEQQSPSLVHYDGAYFAIVQNPDATGTQLETTPKRKVSSRLIMEDFHENR